MTPADVKTRIKAIIKDKYDQEMNDNQTAKDLDLDSLDQIELVMEIEKEFNINIPDENLPINPTLDQLVALVKV